MSMGHEELSTWGKIQDLLRHMLLPTAILVVAGIAIVIRHVRASVVEVLDAPYVRAGRGLGIGQARLLFRHVLPVAARPAISLFGFSIASLLSGSLLRRSPRDGRGSGLLLVATLPVTSTRDRGIIFLLYSLLRKLCSRSVADGIRSADSNGRLDAECGTAS